MSSVLIRPGKAKLGLWVATRLDRKAYRSTPLPLAATRSAPAWSERDPLSLLLHPWRAVIPFLPGAVFDGFSFGKGHGFDDFVSEQLDLLFQFLLILGNLLCEVDSCVASD